MKTLTIKILLTFLPIFFISGAITKPEKKETVIINSSVNSLEEEKLKLEAQIKAYEKEIATILNDVKKSIKTKNTNINYKF